LTTFSFSFTLCIIWNFYLTLYCMIFFVVLQKIENYTNSLEYVFFIYFIYCTSRAIAVCYESRLTNVFSTKSGTYSNLEMAKTGQTSILNGMRTVYNSDWQRSSVVHLLSLYLEPSDEFSATIWTTFKVVPIGSAVLKKQSWTLGIRSRTRDVCPKNKCPTRKCADG